MNQYKDRFLEYFTSINRITPTMLNELLNKTRAGSSCSNDFLRDQTWKKIANSNLYALTYLDDSNNKRYVSKFAKVEPEVNTINNTPDIGIETVDLYGGVKKNDKKQENKNQANKNQGNKNQDNKNQGNKNQGNKNQGNKNQVNNNKSNISNKKNYNKQTKRKTKNTTLQSDYSQNLLGDMILDKDNV